MCKNMQKLKLSHIQHTDTLRQWREISHHHLIAIAFRLLLGSKVRVGDFVYYYCYYLPLYTFVAE